MFWRVPGYSQPSPLEAILDLDNFTLEEVLDEADLIQECKSLNGRLVNFLKEPSTLRALLSYIVDTPAPGKPSRNSAKWNSILPSVLETEWLPREVPYNIRLLSH